MAGWPSTRGTGQGWDRAAGLGGLGRQGSGRVQVTPEALYTFPVACSRICFWASVPNVQAKPCAGTQPNLGSSLHASGPGPARVSQGDSRPTGKDSVLDQTFLRPPKQSLSLGPTLASQVLPCGAQLWQESCCQFGKITLGPWYLIKFCILHRPPGDVCSPWPDLSKNPGRTVLPDPPLPLTFPLSDSPSTCPSHFPTLGYKSPISLLCLELSPVCPPYPHYKTPL